MDQLDVKAAFLNDDLDEVMYMSQPEGFKIKTKFEKVFFVEKLSMV